MGNQWHGKTPMLRGLSSAPVSDSSYPQLSSDGPQVSFGRSPDRRLAVSLNHHVPECPVDPVKVKRLDGRHDPLNRGGRQWDVVRVGVHEADVLPVGNDLNDVAGQEHTATAVAAASTRP